MTLTTATILVPHIVPSIPLTSHQLPVMLFQLLFEVIVARHLSMVNALDETPAVKWIILRQLKNVAYFPLLFLPSVNCLNILIYHHGIFLRHILQNLTPQLRNQMHVLYALKHQRSLSLVHMGLVPPTLVLLVPHLQHRDLSWNRDIRGLLCTS